MKWQIINGNNIDILKTYPDNHFDSIVTDPPYGIAFLGKAWDNDTGAMETWQECLRVLKPGGHLLAFSAARTYHHLATNIESAGFEIRDQLMWLYGSGFPKAQDIGKAIQKRQGVEERKPYSDGGINGLNAYCKDGGDTERFTKSGNTGSVVPTSPEAQQWSGWKTALKPAHEPIVMGRKPFKGSCVDNVLTHGTGALNIDATRIEYEGDKPKAATFKNGISYRQHTDELYGKDAEHTTQRTQEYNDAGRFPSNVIGEVEDYQKYFYCPKVSRKERHIGFEKLPEPEKLNNPEEMKKHPLWDPSIGTNSHRLMKKIREHQEIGNNHPTVKPVELMKYLVRLVTPAGGLVLDPFNGSGSTGMACVEMGYEYVGCELDPEYVEIANNRISAWEKKFDTPANNLFD